MYFVAKQTYNVYSYLYSEQIYEKFLKQTLKLVYLLVVDNGKTIENIRVDKLLF